MKSRTNYRLGSAAFAFAIMALISQTGAQGLAQVSDASYCRDSDGGRNYYKMGTATMGDAGMQDTCLADGSIREYYCTTSGKREVNLTTCPLGFHCAEGACVTGTQVFANASSSASSVATVGCTDSDGGRKASVKGTTVDSLNSRTDSCVSTRAVKEFYCYLSKARSAVIVCSVGSTCKDGACVR